jgi:hypothetical protein
MKVEYLEDGWLDTYGKASGQHFANCFVSAPERVSVSIVCFLN